MGVWLFINTYVYEVGWLVGSLVGGAEIIIIFKSIKYTQTYYIMKERERERES